MNRIIAHATLWVYATAGAMASVPPSTMAKPSVAELRERRIKLAPLPQKLAPPSAQVPPDGA